MDVPVVKSIIHRVKLTYCDNDPFPMSDITECGNSSDFLNSLTVVVNISIENNVFLRVRK